MKKTLCMIVFLAVLFSFTVSFAYENVSEWAEEYVKEAENINLFDKGNFKSSFQNNITREEYCVLVSEIAEKCNLKIDVAESKNPFKDTENESVIKLYNMGIIYGTEEGMFSPYDNLTREEGAEILFRLYMKLFPETRLNKRPSVPQYHDDEKISSWAYTGVYIISEAEIMKGTGDNIFNPQGTYTIEEAVASIVRLYRKYNESTDESFSDSLNKFMPENANYMFSPLSVKMALSLAANGADGETKEEILKTLKIDDLDAFNLKSKDLIKRYTASENLKLNVANSIWINKDKTNQNFSNDFKTLAQEYFDAEVKTVDNDNAVNEVNSWVSEKTNDKIPKIIEENNFWAMLVNAVYFKGLWQNEFSEFATKPDEFTYSDGTKENIDFMNRMGWYSFGKTMNSAIIELPYKTRFAIASETGEFIGNETVDNVNVSMYFIMSDKNISPEKEINEAILTESLKSTYVKLSLPKFKIEYSTKLNYVLKDMGINKAFKDDAEFEKMFDKGNMFISDIVHKTYINVDEKGTEAAAVTTIAMAGSSLPPEPVELKFNKPFYFAIRDNTSGEILFMGRFACKE